MINGKPAKPGMFPFMVVLTWAASEGESHCSGFVVSNTAVLAAAHCLHLGDDQNLLRANYTGRFGTLFKRKGRKIPLRVTIHPKYDSKEKLHDIAVLKPINGEIPMGDKVKSIPLEGKFVEPKNALVMGWGRTTPKDCVRIEGPRTNRLLFRAQRITITGKMKIQVTGDDSSTCKGDSGGPLVEKRNGRYVAFGILSSGINYAARGEESYTRISPYRKFIEDHAGKVEFV